MPPRAKLSDIIDALDMQFDETHTLFDRQTARVVSVTDDDLSAAENEDDLSHFHDWQVESIEIAKAILADEGARARFVSLPDSFDIDEWSMMRDFAASRDKASHCESLQNAVHGRGAFRCFKDRVHELGLADSWYEFRNKQYRRAALDWCEENGIEADPDT